MKKRFVQINGELYERGHEPEVSDHRFGPDVMPDIAPYRSMVTGEIINSRSRHREHLRERGLTEIGNDSSLAKPYQGMPKTDPAHLKEILRAQVNAMTHDQFKKAGRMELENLRWNNRKD